MSRRATMTLGLLALWIAVARAGPDGVGYPTVDAAFRALKSDPSAILTIEGDFMVFRRESPDGSSDTWKFTRPGHPAHPGVIHVHVDPASGETERSSLCEAHYSEGCSALERTPPE